MNDVALAFMRAEEPNIGIAQERQSSYKDYIEEAFITPIRTAVVVDDEFPTLDDFLTAPVTAASKPELESAKKIIDFCRNQKPHPWIVDIHDGKNIDIKAEESSTKQFDHTDLLILDYHLNGQDGSEKAISILRSLAANKHFNLVVVYTNADRVEGGGIDRTVSEIALALTTASNKFELKIPYAKHIETKLSIWENLDDDILSKLLATLDEFTYQKILSSGHSKWEELQRLPELDPLSVYIENIPESVTASKNEVFSYVINKYQKSIANKMSATSYGEVRTNINGDVNWIHLETLFVTVIPKSDDAARIPGKLLDALDAWHPDPHRLLMSKMRVELGQNGVGAEAKVLENRHLQVAWLEDLLEPDPVKRHTNVTRDVSRHWESLGDKIKPNIFDFAKRVATSLTTPPKTNDEIFSRFNLFEVSKQSEFVLLEMNSHVCSKQVEGHHLTTGQIIQIDKGGPSCSLWLILSPACDLVPNQKNTGWKKQLGKWSPLNAVRLFCASNEDAVKSATQGHHLFLNIDDVTSAFGFSDAGIKKQNPTLIWEQFFVKNEGQFDIADKSISVARVKNNGEALVFEEKQATIVAQLRYEYALNLMQKLGMHLSRVGLDFVGAAPIQIQNPER